MIGNFALSTKRIGQSYFNMIRRKNKQRGEKKTAALLEF
jgi:hypothetical protein